MLKIDFLENDLRIVSPPRFLYDFHCLIVFFAGCDAINFEINPTFLVKPFFYMTKTPRKEFKYLENKKNF